MRRQGAEKPAFETIVATGERSALPHAQPGAARLTAGDLVVVDMGAFQEGYASDMTRMLRGGRARMPRTKHMYRAVREAQLAAIDAVRPNADDGERGSRRAQRAGRPWTGSLLHTLHRTRARAGDPRDPADCGKREQERAAAKAGMAITIEPGAYIEGLRRAWRIEDTVVVTQRRGAKCSRPRRKDLQSSEVFRPSARLHAQMSRACSTPCRTVSG